MRKKLALLVGSIVLISGVVYAIMGTRNVKYKPNWTGTIAATDNYNWIYRLVWGAVELAQGGVLKDISGQPIYLTKMQIPWERFKCFSPEPPSCVGGDSSPKIGPTFFEFGDCEITSKEYVQGSGWIYHIDPITIRIRESMCFKALIISNDNKTGWSQCSDKSTFVSRDIQVQGSYLLKGKEQVGVLTFNLPRWQATPEKNFQGAHLEITLPMTKFFVAPQGELPAPPPASGVLESDTPPPSGAWISGSPTASPSGTPAK